jgi:uncharacterized protein YoxC
MGKKKDKAKKSKKHKSEKDTVIEAESGHITDLEHGGDSIEFAEYVTAADVMELINSLEQGLDKLDKSNQLLKEQIVQNQKSPQRQEPILKIITLVLGIGIIALGYHSAKTNSRMDEHMGIVSTDMGRMSSRIKSMNSSIESTTGDINNINTRLGTLSTDVSTINQSVDKLATDVNRTNASTSSTPQNTRYRGRTTDPRMQWR